MNYQVVDG